LGKITFFTPCNFIIIGIGQEADIILGIRSQQLVNKAELGGKVGVGEKKSHEGQRDLVIGISFKRKL
jgi:hypothetical protein